MKRGDLVTIALQGDYGKPRPAMVLQSDLFSDHPSVTVLPVTSEMRGDLLFRINVEPSSANGLRRPSQIMIDKAQTVSREKIDAPLGQLEDRTILAVNQALFVFLGLA